MADATARMLVVTDLLLGAVYADGSQDDEEIAEVRRILSELVGKDPLPEAFEKRIAEFDPETFDVYERAEAFKQDEAVLRVRLLELVGNVRDANDEYDLAEDDYLKQLAAALDVPPSELDGLTLEYEIEELASSLSLRSVPPAVPKK